MNRNHLIKQVYSEAEWRRNLKQLQMEAFSFVRPCKNGVLKWQWKGLISACKVSGTDGWQRELDFFNFNFVLITLIFNFNFRTFILSYD
jgi:hypothetical protein